MIVWLVECADDYEPSMSVGLFSSLDKAEQWVSERGLRDQYDNVFICKMTVDDPDE